MKALGKSLRSGRRALALLSLQAPLKQQSGGEIFSVRWACWPRITHEPFHIMQTPLMSSGLYVTNWQVRSGTPDPSLAEEDKQCLKEMDPARGEVGYVRRQTETS